MNCRKCNKKLTINEFKGAYINKKDKMVKYWVCSDCGTRTDIKRRD